MADIARIESETLRQLGPIPGRSQDVFGFDASWFFYLDGAIQSRLSTMCAGIEFRRTLEETGNIHEAISAAQNCRDAFGGAPLKHRIGNQEVMFYSVGRDGDDDEGRTGNIYGNDGDIAFTVAVPAKTRQSH